MTAQLIKYEAARVALAAAHRVDEVKDIRDKAEAMAAYARQAKDVQLIMWATEIKVRAERRCGEMLRSTALSGDRATPRGNVNQHVRVSNDATPTLQTLGITRDQSSRYQKLAAMPAEHFEAAVETAKATAGEVTSAHMLRMADLLKRNADMRADLDAAEAKGAARQTEIESRAWWEIECAFERIVELIGKTAAGEVPPCDAARAVRVVEMLNTAVQFLSTHLRDEHETA